MAEIKTILLDVQRHLGMAVPKIAYLDKDWGQLYFEQPPVRWPCVLLDIEEIKYEQRGHGSQQANTQISVTVAGMRIKKSSNASPDLDKAYELIDLMEDVHDALQLFTNDTGDFAPLFRSSVKKILSDTGKEAYKMTYETAYATAPPSGSRPKHQAVKGVTLQNE